MRINNIQPPVINISVSKNLFGYARSWLLNNYRRVIDVFLAGIAICIAHAITQRQNHIFLSHYRSKYAANDYEWLLFVEAGWSPHTHVALDRRVQPILE